MPIQPDRSTAQITTQIGRATGNRLDLNDEKRQEPFIQAARKQWVASGLHPPDDDPIEKL